MVTHPKESATTTALAFGRLDDCSEILRLFLADVTGQCMIDAECYALFWFVRWNTQVADEHSVILHDPYIESSLKSAF